MPGTSYPTPTLAATWLRPIHKRIVPALASTQRHDGRVREPHVATAMIARPTRFAPRKLAHREPEASARDHPLDEAASPEPLLDHMGSGARREAARPIARSSCHAAAFGFMDSPPLRSCTAVFPRRERRRRARRSPELDTVERERLGNCSENGACEHSIGGEPRPPDPAARERRRPRPRGREDDLSRLANERSFVRAGEDNEPYNATRPVAMDADERREPAPTHEAAVQRPRAGLVPRDDPRARTSRPYRSGRG